MSYDKGYFEKLDSELIEKIENSIKEKEGIDEIKITSIRDIPDNPINEINNFLLIDYNPVFKCEYTKKDGQQVSYYIKPSISQFNNKNLCKTPLVNGITAVALAEMGSMGYTIPEFSYFKDLTINMGGEEVNFNILTTENVEEILDKKYLKSNEEITEISEIEAIDRLLLQHKYGGICDNKTINTKVYKKSNDNKKTIYFDPNIYNINNLTNSFHFIKLALAKCLAKEKNEGVLDENTYYNKNYYNDAEKASFKKLEEFDINSFEYYLTRFLVDFVKEEIIKKKDNLIGDNNKFTRLKIQSMEKDIENLNNFSELNLENFLEIAKNNYIIRKKNFFNNNDFCDFLLIKKDKLTTKEKNEHLLKKAYYYKKNQENLNNILNKEDIENIDGTLYFMFSTNKESLDEDLLNIDTKDYQPVILSNVVGKTYGNMSLLNFKQPKGILYFEGIKENSDFKIEQLYKENKNRKLEDMTILIDKDKISNIESKEGRKEIQNIILKSLIDLSNDNNISLPKLSYIILKSINTGDELLNEDEKDICGKFKGIMENKGIYSVKKIENQNDNNIKFEKSDGLEFKNLPKGIIELLIDRKEEFEVKFEEDQKRLDESLERKDGFIIKRVLKELEGKNINIELNY